MTGRRPTVFARAGSLRSHPHASRLPFNLIEYRGDPPIVLSPLEDYVDSEPGEPDMRELLEYNRVPFAMTQ